MIVFDHVSKVYSNGTVGLDDVNLTIQDGEFVAIIGRSGAGKSTFLKLIQMEEKPTEGKVFINGQDLTRIKRRKVPYLRRQMGIIFQDFRLIPTMTVYENVAFAMHVTNIGKKDIKERVNYMLELVHLEDKAKAYPAQLSGGQQQRVAIGRALITRPTLILADEPTGNLDTQNSSEVIALLKETSKKYEQTILMITHNRSIAQTADRVLQVSDGCLTDFGRAQDVRGTSALLTPEGKENANE